MKQLNFKLFASAIFLFISTNFYSVSAQTSPPIGMGWMNENACSVYESEGHYLIENLDNLPCIQVCLGSESLFWLTGVHPNWVITWTVFGGDIISQPPLKFLKV